MFLIAKNLHLGSAIGGDFISRTTTGMKIKPYAAPGSANLFEGFPIQDTPTPVAKKLLGSLYIGGKLTFAQHFFVQLNGYGGGSLFGNEFFSTPWHVGGEAIIGMSMSRILVGLTGGAEYMQHSLVTILGSHDNASINFVLIKNTPPQPNSFGYCRGFGGIMLGYKFTSTLTPYIKVHYTMGSSKTEKTELSFESINDQSMKVGESYLNAQYRGWRVLAGLDWEI